MRWREREGAESRSAPWKGQRGGKRARALGRAVPSAEPGSPRRPGGSCSGAAVPSRAAEAPRVPLALHPTAASSVFAHPQQPPEGGAPFPEVLQYRDDARSGGSKLRIQLPSPKIRLI